MNRPANPAAPHQAAFTWLVILAFFAALILGAIRAAAQSPSFAPTPKPQTSCRIVISISDHKLALLQDDKIVKVYDVAVGAAVSPSPNGEYVIARRLENPAYYHPGVVIDPGASNPLGPRWIGLNVKGFGIHGTNHPESIGKNASHGCIRLRNRDIQDLFARVQVGDRVSILAERNDEVARLFGPAPDSQQQATQTMVAKNEPATAAAPEAEQHGER
jgi:L,D-transpeptidase catalytic domain